MTLVLCIAPLGLQNSCNPVRHTLHQIPTLCLRKRLPLPLNPCPQLQHRRRRVFVGGKLAFEGISEMLDGIEVRGLRRPLHDLNFVLLEALFGLFTGVLGVVSTL